MTHLVLGEFMRSLSLICLSFLVLPAVSIARGMPDEINYPYYERQLGELEQQRDELITIQETILRDLRITQTTLDQLNREVSDEDRELSRLYQRDEQIQRQRSATLTQMERNQVESRGLRAELDSRQRDHGKNLRIKDSLNQEKSRFFRDLNRQQGVVNSLTQHLSSLESQASAITRQIAELDREISAVRSQIKSIDSEIERATRQIREKKAERSRLSSRQTTISREINDLRSKVRSLKTQISSLDRKVAQIKTAIARISRELQVLDQNYNSKNQTFISYQRELSRLQRMSRRDYAKEAELKRKISSLKQELSRLKLKISSKKTELSKNQSSLTSTTKLLSAKQTEVTNLSKKITDLERLKQQIPALISNLNREIQGLERLVVQKTSRKVSLQDSIRGKSRQVSQLRSALEGKNREITQKRGLLAKEQRELDSINSSYQSVLGKLSRLEQEIVANVNRIKFIERRIPELDRINSSLRFQVNELSEERNRNSRLMSQIQRTVDQLNEEIEFQNREQRRIKLALNSNQRDLDSVNRTLSDVTRQRDNRFSKYQMYLSEASTRGRTSGADQASGDAYRSGENDAIFQAEGNAKVFGENIGLLTGYLDGLVDGAKDGKVEGLRQGRADESSYNEGYTRGYQAGLNAAKDRAKNVVYPNTFRQLRDKLLSEFKNNGEALFNSFNRNLDAPALDDKNSQGGIDELIKFTRAELNRLDAPSVKLSKPSYAYTTPEFSVPSVGRTCDDVYPYIDMQRACEESFVRGYEGAYLSKHKEAYFSEYERSYNPIFGDEFSKNKTVRFQEGRSKGYELSYDEYFAIGAGERYQGGFESGQKKGFDENIGSLSEAAKSRAQGDVNSFYASSSLVGVVDESNITLKSDAPKNELRAGASVAVSLLVKNVGGADLSSGKAKVRLTNLSSNISADNSWVSLPRITKESKLEIEDVLKLKIKDSAKPGEPLSFVLEIKSEGDNVDSPLIEKIKVQKNIKVNPNVDVSIEFDEKTRWRKWKFWPFKWVHRVNEVEVFLSGINQGVRGKYKVQLVKVSGPNEVKTFDKSSTLIEAPRINQTRSASVSYQFDGKVRKQWVNFNLIVSYDGEVIREKQFRVYIK